MYRFRLTVTDDDGAETTSTTRDLTIIAGDSRNNRPVVRISDPDTLRVASGATLALEATASDSDGTVESYAWSAAQADDATASGVGAFATRGAGARADWTAPTPTNATDYVLTVTVTDDDGGEGSASVTVTVIGDGEYRTDRNADGRQGYRRRRRSDPAAGAGGRPRRSHRYLRLELHARGRRLFHGPHRPGIVQHARKSHVAGTEPERGHGVHLEGHRHR